MDIVRQLLAAEHTLDHAAKQHAKRDRPRQGVLGFRNAEFRVIVLERDLDKAAPEVTVAPVGALDLRHLPGGERLVEAANGFFV